MAFRGDQYLWWQIAEYGYDTYMIPRAQPRLIDRPKRLKIRT